MQCPACSTDVPSDSENLFCEECGAALSPQQAPAAGCVCGASVADRDEDGFCMRCGRKHRLPLPADHLEESLAPHFATVTDRGLRHDRNEDRCGIFMAREGYAMVVCDGVSTSYKSEIASAAVAEGVLKTLSQALLRAAVEDPAQLLREAIANGNSHIDIRVNLDTRRTSASRKLKKAEANPPSTTVVAALVTGSTATIAWVGDSRAYWIDATSALPLTRDHSWQNDVVQAGVMSAEEAAKSPKAHAITRWLGPDADPGQPDLYTLAIDRPGTLLLCTDGLWNYAASPEQMLATMQAAAAPDALTLARNLAQFALDQGGQDNVSVAILQLTPHQQGA